MYFSTVEIKSFKTARRGIKEAREVEVEEVCAEMFVTKKVVKI